IKNSTGNKSRWWFIEWVLVCAREWQRVLDPRAKTCARFCGGSVQINCRGGASPANFDSATGVVALQFGGMRTFGGFRSGNRFFYGELRGEKVYELAQPYWIDIRPTGEVLPLANVRIGSPVAPSKLIAVGLNYADHVAEMKRTELGTPLIWFKSPNSVLPHNERIEIAFPEHQTDFEVELATVIGRTAKNVAVERALDFVFGYTVALDITDRD